MWTSPAHVLNRVRTFQPISKLYERNKIYTTTLPTGTITDAGVINLRTFLFGSGIFLSGLDHLGWEWKWTTNRGTLPKRLANLYHKEKGGSLDVGILTEVGNIARRNCPSVDTVRWDYSYDLDWDAGDYGDDDSCFWGGNSGARTMLKEHGAYAFRVYNADEEGIGRCWCWDAPEGFTIMFNGYGFDTLWFVRVLSMLTGATYTEITLLNKGSDSGLLWVNSGRGFTVGVRDKLRSHTTYDFKWNTDVDSPDDGIQCAGCGQWFPEDDFLCDDNDNPVLCPSCGFRCGECAEICERNDRHWAPTSRCVCTTCWEENYFHCERCQTVKPASTKETLPDGEVVCRSCHTIYVNAHSREISPIETPFMQILLNTPAGQPSEWQRRAYEAMHEMTPEQVEQFIAAPIGGAR